MSAAAPGITLEPRFLDGGSGPVFTLYFAPTGPPRGAVLHLAAFGEEMNRCRAAVARQAQALALRGYACLLLDNYGTGDSGGDLPDADWSCWRNDAQLAADWLARRTGHSVTLWGVRLGALLAADVANTNPERFPQLLFWQPIANGNAYLTQLLRLRVAALVDRNAPPEKTAQMRERLADGEVIELSGYLLSGPLAEAIAATRIDAMQRLDRIKVDWFEVVAAAGKPLSVGSRKVIEGWIGRGAFINARGVLAPPLWNLHKQADASALIEATSTLFGNMTAGDLP